MQGFNEPPHWQTDHTHITVSAGLDFDRKGQVSYEAPNPVALISAHNSDLTLVGASSLLVANHGVFLFSASTQSQARSPPPAGASNDK